MPTNGRRKVKRAKRRSIVKAIKALPVSFSPNKRPVHRRRRPVAKIPVHRVPAVRRRHRNRRHRNRRRASRARKCKSALSVNRRRKADRKTLAPRPRRRRHHRPARPKARAVQNSRSPKVAKPMMKRSVALATVSLLVSKVVLMVMTSKLNSNAANVQV